tara:strand:+ start:184 stop:339 length:156 start_codon:yes stop_codon:yes gene_type:complete
MIIFGKPIHRKYVKKITIILLILGSVLLMSCNKLEFDPTTTTLKYILQEKK